MKIVVLENNTLENKPAEIGNVIEGETYVELVQALQISSPFMEADSADRYMESILLRMNSPLLLKGDPEHQARIFIRHLAGCGLVGFLVSADEEVPPQLWEAILQIRDSGLTNMFDYLQVAHLMEQSGYKLEAAWVNDHPGKYGEMILGVGRPLGGEKPCADR